VVNLFGTEGVYCFSEACLNNFVDLMQYRLLLDLRHSGTRMLIIFRQVYSYIWHTYNNRDGCWRSRFICVGQKPSSPIPPAEVRRNLEDLGDYLFSDRKSPPLLLRNTRDGRQVFVLLLLHTKLLFPDMIYINCWMSWLDIGSRGFQSRYAVQGRKSNKMYCEFPE